MSRDGGNNASSVAPATVSHEQGVPPTELLPLVYEHLRQLAAMRIAQEPPGQTLQPTALVHEAYLRIIKGGTLHVASSEASCDGVRDCAAGSSGAAGCREEIGPGPTGGVGRWASKEHFFAAAAVAMRRILIERARAKRGPKRGGDRLRVPFDEGVDPGSFNADAVDWLAIDEALCALEKMDPELARLVQLRCFAGLSAVETAGVMGTSERTVHRDWKIARAAMLRHLEGL